MDSNNATGVYVEALQIGARGYETIIYPFKRQPLIFHNMKDQHEQCSKKTRLFFFLRAYSYVAAMKRQASVLNLTDHKKSSHFFLVVQKYWRSACRHTKSSQTPGMCLMSPQSKHLEARPVFFFSPLKEDMHGTEITDCYWAWFVLFAESQLQPLDSWHSPRR